MSGIIWTLVTSGFVALVVPAAIAFLSKEFIANWIGSRVQHGFDVKLAELNGRIKDKQDQIDAMRSGALTLLSKQHEAFNERTLLAIERLWADVQHDKYYDTFLGMVSRVNFKKAIELYEQNDSESKKIKEFFDALWTTSNVEKNFQQKRNNISLDRIYIPDDVYKAYIAYVGISSHIIITVSTIRHNAPTALVRDKAETAASIKAVLPHQANLIDEWELESYYLFRGEIESLILKKLVSILTGNSRAIEVVKGTALVMNEALKQDINAINALPKVPDSIKTTA